MAAQPALPRSEEFNSWEQVEPYLQELAVRRLTAENVEAWLVDWTELLRLVMETEQRRYVATTVNTDDKDAEQRYYTFLEKIFPAAQAAEQQIKQKLLSSELEPPAFDVPLRNMRVQARMFREANLPLRTEEQKLATEYDKIAGAQTVEWEGRELTLQQLHPVYQNTDRTLRERAWRLEQARRLQDQAALDALWVKLLQLRLQIAANADFPDYRAYRWQQLQRVDYTPADCVAFHQAVEQVAVPAATRIYERRRQRLGLETLRPWDLDVNSLGLAPLRPFTEVADLEARSAAILRRVDPELGAQFEIMRREGLLDLANRVGKAPGGYCTVFPAAERPFIFMNAVGLHNDVVTLLHESGHAFHVFHIFGAGRLPYYQQWDVGMEFAEVVSMAMELLGAPYLPADEGGFYSVQEAARARIEHLEGAIIWWPRMAVVDAFQHWVYEHPDAAADPARCRAFWVDLSRRFEPSVDWSGLEAAEANVWQQILHIFQLPFYFIEYAMAQLGAVQIWRNALRDQASAVARYRRALALGGTVALPQLYDAAGATFAFDANTLAEAIALIE